ncbi:MAG: ABC transporter permease [Bryobacteraceae bacterium]
MISNDLLYAVRALRKSPVFTLTAVLTISLGIAACTAVFSVTHAVLLRPLPYKNPGRLVLACGEMRRRNVTDLPFSDPDFLDLRNGAKASFQDFAAVWTGDAIFPREDGSLEEIRYASVTPNFFRLLGGRIAIGRDFIEADGRPQTPGDNRARGSDSSQRLPTIAILSYDYWQRRYGRSTTILGHGMFNRGSGGPQIVGVLAPGFELLFPPSLNVERLPDIWLAARLNYDNAQRKTFTHRVIGRLKDGVSLASARRETEGVAAGLRKNFSLWNTSDFHIRLESMSEYLVAQVEPAILALMGAAVFLLLIACANVANLLLVRASLRERELAVRAALGGGRWRLIRQVLAEALVLAGFATLLGLGLAWAGIHELLAIAPANVPRMDSVAIDPTVIAFTGLAGLLAAGIFGVIPALRASRPDLMNVLRASGRATGMGSGRLLRSGAVVAEIALSFVLLIGSGLMLRSFVALQHINPGFESSGLLTFELLAPRLPTAQQRGAFMREIQERLRSIPGVESVTAASPFPLADEFYPIRWGTAQALADASKFQAVDSQQVLPGYFETLHTPLLAGRTFTDADNAPDRNIVVVDQLLAAKAFPHESAVGKRILIRIRTPEPEWVEVIGVVAHQRDSSLAELGREQIYFTDGFLGHDAATRWAVRTAGNPASYARAVREAVRKLGRQLVITEAQPMDAVVERAQAATRFSLLLIGVFASIAATLAAVGIYGVLSTAVRQRTAEIGVRMALGAAPGSIFRLVVGHGLSLTAMGIAAGVVAALGLTRALASLLVGVKSTDPATFIVMIGFFLIIASLAACLPARRAAGLDPATALREE